MKFLRLAAVALTIFSVSTPVSPAATTSGTKNVIGGTDANAGEFPFFVQGQGCGASLIWYDIALSAAHCAGWPFNRSAVLIGNHIRDQVTDGVITRNVLKQVIHPDYNPSTLDNDFLVLKLSDEVPRTGTIIKPIELNDITSNPADNAPLTTIGFGQNETVPKGYGAPTPRLQKATLYSVSQTTCESGTINNVSSNMLCTFAQNKSICFGDSGGPLIDARGVQVGVSSWVSSKNCTARSYFARVSEQYSWIRTQICWFARNPPAYCRTVILTNSSIVEGDPTTIVFMNEGLSTQTSGRVDWGDGSVDSRTTNELFTHLSFTHVYKNDGTYTIKTNFTYGTIALSTQYQEFSMRVNNAAPTIVLSGIPNTRQVVPYNATVFITCSDAGVLDTESISVHWNDNSTIDRRNVSAPASVHCKNVPFSHLYTKFGTYTIRAIVKDSRGIFSKLASSTLVTVSGRRGL